MAYRSIYFAQESEADSNLNCIHEHGAAAWLDMLRGALDFSEGDEYESAPWGLSDTLIHSETDSDGDVLRVHMGKGGLYVSVTLEHVESI